MSKHIWPVVLILLSGCGDKGNTDLPVTAKAPEAPDLSERIAGPGAKVYHCTDTSLVLEQKGGSSMLYLDGQKVPVQQRQSSSGIEYAGTELHLVTSGKEATLTTRGASQGCRLDPKATAWDSAKLKGVDFRALGNEPGWQLEISGTAMELDTDYGQQRFKSGARRLQQGDKTLFEGSGFSATLSPGPCVDDMSGERFDTKVDIRLESQQLHGCGNFLK